MLASVTEFPQKHEYSQLYFHDSKFSHEIHENIVPQKFQTIRYSIYISHSYYNMTPLLDSLVTGQFRPQINCRVLVSCHLPVL